MLDYLESLSNAPGVSGNEGAVRQIIREAVQEHVDEVRVDHLGNLIAVKKPQDEPKTPLRVMVAAHMDEVGFMVVDIDNNGYLKFRNVGGVDPRILPAKEVLVGDKGVLGVIGTKPIHLQKRGEADQVMGIEHLRIDIGANTQSQAKESVKPGDYAVFATAFSRVGKLVKGKAFDDRAGCAALIEILKGDYPFELYGVFTVQEEVGLRGARVAAYALEPHAAFVLEGTISDDLPKDKDTSPTAEVGKGPVITLMDRTFFADRRLVELLVETAQANDIPYQFKQPGVGGTDAGAIHLAREGIPSATVAAPCRYIHAPAALLDPLDWENMVKLMTETLHTAAQRLPKLLDIQES